MPMPTPNVGESEDDFIERCMGDDVMNDEFPDKGQRWKVCENQWEENRGEIMEIRGFKFETRETEDEGHFEGIANAYDVIDDYGSKFQKGAFKKTLEEQDKIPLVWFHDPTQPIGQARAWETDEGLKVDGQLDLNIQKAQEVYSGMQKGYVNTMSIGFDTIQSDTNSEGIEVKKEAKLFEASPLTQNFAANPGANISEVRSMTKGIRRINQSIKDETERDLNKAITELRKLLDKYEIRTTTSFQDFPLASRDKEWSQSEAEDRIREKTGAEDEPNSDYAKCFMWYDGENSDNFGAYKLQYADVVGGTLKTVPRGIFAVAAVLQGSRGGVDIPSDDESTVKNHVEKYYKKMRNKWDDYDDKAPWNEEESIDDLLTEARNKVNGSIARLEGGSRETTFASGSPQGSRDAGADPHLVEEIKRAAEKLN